MRKLFKYFKSRIIFDSILLISIIIFYSINNYIWIKNRNPFPLYPDESEHLIQSFRYYRLMIDPNPVIFKNLIYLIKGYRFPPFFLFTSAMLNLLFGASKVVSTMTNILYLAILLFSVYYLGKKSDNRNVGLLSAFILSMFPFVFGMSRVFMLDFALMAMITFSICSLVYTNNFTSTKFSLFFGVSLGLGMLTKWTYPLFIIGPLLYTLFCIFKQLQISKFSSFRIQISNILLSFSIGFFLSLLYYYDSEWLGKGITKNSFLPTIVHETNWRTFSGCTFYIRSIFPWQVSLPFSILFLFILPIFLKSHIKYKPTLFYWLITPITILTFIPNKWGRHIMPVLPSIALILAIGIEKLSWKKLKVAVISLIFIVGVSQYLLISYNKNFEYKHQSFMGSIFSPPKVETELSKIVNNIIPDFIIPNSNYNSSTSSNKNINIGVIDSVPLMMLSNAFNYSIIEKALNCSIFNFPDEHEYILRNFIVDKLDYIITVRPKDNPWPSEKEIRQIFKIEQFGKMFNISDKDYEKYVQIFAELASNFRIIKTINCSNKFYIFILSKKVN